MLLDGLCRLGLGRLGLGRLGLGRFGLGMLGLGAHLSSTSGQKARTFL